MTFSLFCFLTSFFFEYGTRLLFFQTSFLAIFFLKKHEKKPLHCARFSSPNQALPALSELLEHPGCAPTNKYDLGIWKNFLEVIGGGGGGRARGT